MNTRPDTEALDLLLRHITDPDLPLPDDELLPAYAARRGVFCAPDTRELATAIEQDDQAEAREVIVRLMHEGARFTVRSAVASRNADGVADPLLSVTFAGCGCKHLLYLSEVRLDGDDRAVGEALEVTQ